jgi:hypothetical protein
MTAGGSQQQRIFRRAIRDGAGLIEAANAADMAIAEARLLANEDARNPPPPEAYELLVTTPPAPPCAEPENVTMGRAKKKIDVVELVGAPDFGLAVRIYREDIKPAQSKVGEYAQEQSTAYKEIKKTAFIQPQAAKLAFKLDAMEESKRDDFLRSLNGLLKELRIFMPADLVDAAEGKAGTSDAVVPIGERRRPQLATVPTGPEGDQDPIDAAGGEPEQQAAE